MKKIILSAVLSLFLFNAYGQSGEKLMSLANAKNTAHDYTGAIAMYDKAIALNPKNALAFFNRGTSKLNIADNTGACSDLKRASELGYKKADESIAKFCH